MSHLSTNDMLTTGDNRRRRERGTVRVSKPSFGFFIAGSSIEEMNGVYIQANLPDQEDDEPLVALNYVHEDTDIRWTMVLVELPKEEREEEDPDDYFYYGYRKKKPKTHEWYFRDPNGMDRFSHDGDTIVPGAGVRWKHVHRTTEGAKTTEESSDDFSKRMREMGMFQSEAMVEKKKDDENELPWQVIAILDKEILEQLVWGSRWRKKKVREAMSGKSMAAPSKTSLEGNYQPGKWLYKVTHKDGVDLMDAAYNEGEYAGRREHGEYVRVIEVTTDGLWLRLDSTEDTEKNNRQQRRDPYYDFYQNFEYGQRELWAPAKVQDGTGTGALIEALAPVEEEDGAVLEMPAEEGGRAIPQPTTEDGKDGKGAEEEKKADPESLEDDKVVVEEDEGADPHGEAFFDKPFIPRMKGDGDEEEDSNTALVDYRNEDVGSEEAKDIALKVQEAATNALQSSATPVGTRVIVNGLQSRGGRQYNSTRGVIVSPLDLANGRQGVRLDAPYSGKQIKIKPQNVQCAPPDEEEVAAAVEAAESDIPLEDEENGGPTAEEKRAERVRHADSLRYAHLLGVSLLELGLSEGAINKGKRKASGDGNEDSQDEDKDKKEDAEAEKSKEGGGEGEGEEGTEGGKNENEVHHYGQHGWGFVGSTPQTRLATALRAAERDTLGNPAAAYAARTSYAALAESLAAKAEKDLDRKAAVNADANADADAEAEAEAEEAADEAAPAAGTTTAAATAEAAAAAATAPNMPSPLQRVICGGLGARVAAAARAAGSTTSLAEAERGVLALRGILNEEARCIRGQSGAGSVEGSRVENHDALLLQLALVEAMWGGRRESDALSQASMATKAFPDSAAASAVHARCLLRCGKRIAGMAALEKADRANPHPDAEKTSAAASTAPAAAAASASTSSADVEDVISPADGEVGGSSSKANADVLPYLERWGRQEAARMMRSVRSSDRRQARAMAFYERGQFEDAAKAYLDALACLEAGLKDDKRGRAMMYASRAGCFRRARKLDEAVEACDAALRLFPRYHRALFRRAACLLEANNYEGAIKAFEALYRVDRKWPRLDDWLVRAHAMKRRAEKAAAKKEMESDSDDEENSDEDEEEARQRRKERKARKRAQQKAQHQQDAPKSAAEVLSHESDHYTVLGIPTDATEKQMKTAYRMMSLRYHPDKAGGSTAAFQRIALAYQTLSDPETRRDYDEGGDIKVKRKTDDSDEEEYAEEEEHKQTLREEILREYYPERYDYWPFGDPFIQKRKREEQLRKRAGKPAWYDSHDY